MEKKYFKILSLLSLIIAPSLAIVSCFGAFVPATYKRDAASMAAQGMGQDMVDLFLVVPLLLLSLWFFRRGFKAAAFVFGGSLFYISYSFFIYAFGVNFNSLFLLYCLILGLSLYSFVIFLIGINQAEVEDWFSDGLPVRFIGFFLLAVAGLFYLLWLKDVLPSVLQNTVPKTVSDYNLLVNPVHVLDLAIALPGLIIAAFLLIKKRRLGYILAPISLVFVVIMAIALAAMVLMLNVKKISDDISVAVIFVMLALISLVILRLFMKKLKPN